MTGMHSGHAQIRANDEMAYRGAIMNYDSMYVHPGLEGQYPLKAHTMTLGRMMQQAGYVTGCFGKWGLGAPGTEGTPNKQGFDSFYGYNCQRQAHSYYPAFLYKNEDRVYLANKVLDPHTTKLDAGADPRDEAAYAKFSQKEYANDLIFDELISFVGQTFLLQLLYQLAYLLVKITDHSSISRMRIATRHISGFSDVGGFVSKLPDIILHPFLRCLQRHVR